MPKTFEDKELLSIPIEALSVAEWCPNPYKTNPTCEKMTTPSLSPFIIEQIAEFKNQTGVKPDVIYLTPSQAKNLGDEMNLSPEGKPLLFAGIPIRIANVFAIGGYHGK